MPIDVSNVLLYCPQAGRGVRVGTRFTADGRKERYCKVTGASLGVIGPAKAEPRNEGPAFTAARQATLIGSVLARTGLFLSAITGAADPLSREGPERPKDDPDGPLARPVRRDDRPGSQREVRDHQQDGDPQLEKIVINMGVGRATQDKAVLDAAVDSLGKITGQKPVITKAKVSVSGFRLREGNDIGCKVTLRGKRMYEFLDRLISIALPRIRDFRGVNPNSFDGHGNYTLGLAEQVVFPEIDADKIHHTQGMDITVVTTSDNDDQARELLRSFGMPFRQPQQRGGKK